VHSNRDEEVKAAGQLLRDARVRAGLALKDFAREASTFALATYPDHLKFRFGASTLADWEHGKTTQFNALTARIISEYAHSLRQKLGDNADFPLTSAHQLYDMWIPSGAAVEETDHTESDEGQATANFEPRKRRRLMLGSAGLLAVVIGAATIWAVVFKSDKTVTPLGPSAETKTLQKTGLFTEPTFNSAMLRELSADTTVNVVCHVATLEESTISVWYKTLEGSYISDDFLSTDTNNVIVGKCSGSKPITARKGQLFTAIARVPAEPHALRVREAPVGNARVLREEPSGNRLELSCFLRSEPIFGNDIWYRLKDGSYVSAVNVFTGILAPAVDACPTAGS
jgi:transcriptional regulator with XRE-family HTH domain